MSQLNRQQAAAVHYIDTPLLVIAGAGSGKTRVITQKIQYLIESCGYKAKNIAAITFTNKAAKEMKARISQHLETKQRRGLTVSTFHTLGLNIIRQALPLLGLRPGFSIFDEYDSATIIRSFLPSTPAPDKDFIKQVLTQISNWKNARISPTQANVIAATPIAVDASRFYADYNEHLQAYNAVDFDDLISLPTQLFMQFPEQLQLWQDRIRYLLIDEYQDTNESQYHLINLLAGLRGAFTAVGDDDQSIYAWRGAKPDNLLTLQKDYPQLRLMKLEQNYRSSGCILEAANTLISHNPHIVDKKLWSQFGFGELIRVLEISDEYSEAEQIIAELISHRLHHNTALKDYAILYRGNHQSRLFEKALRENNIPYRISGSVSFFSRAEIKDIFAYIKLICNPDDDAAFLRIINTPKRGIGSSTLQKLGQYAKQCECSLYSTCNQLGLLQQLPQSSADKLQHFYEFMQNMMQRCENVEDIVAALYAMLKAIGYEDWLYEQYENPKTAESRQKNINDFIEWIAGLLRKADGDEASLATIVSKMMLLDILENQDDSSVDQVQLMTLHAAKGLEFPYVYLVGMEEGLLPHQSSIDADQVEEERRLAYVGITRAQKALTLSYVRKRRKQGEAALVEPSRFLKELPQKTLDWCASSEKSQVDVDKTAQFHLQSLRNLLAEKR